MSTATTTAISNNNDDTVTSASGSNNNIEQLFRKFDRSVDDVKEIDEIPVVDIGPLVDGSDPQQVADRMAQTFEQTGFMYVINHGIDDKLYQRVYTLGEEFFALPMEEKCKVHLKHSGLALRGYLPPFIENVDPQHHWDYKESFEVGADTVPDKPFFGPNPIPNRPSGFDRALNELHGQLMILGRKLSRALALSLDLPATYFEPLQQNPISYLRMTHYPPAANAPTRTTTTKEEEKKDHVGIGAHTDFGFLTILSQDDMGGLQVFNRNGKWVNVPPIPGALIINIGDLVQMLTNDRYVSTIHRVIPTNPLRSRYSVPFFMYVDYETKVEPLAQFVNNNHPPKHRPLVCGDYRFECYKNVFPHLAHLKKSKE